jgi:hypothetical protein
LFPDDPVFGDTQLFAQSFEKQYGLMPDDYAAFGAMSGVIYQTALKVKAKCDSNGTINIS